MVSRLNAGIGAATVAVLLSAACTEPAGRPQEVDLLATLPSADARAGSDVRTAVRPDVVTVAGDSRTALVLRAPARVTWPVDLPHHAELRTAVALLPDGPQDVTVRIGLSDDRVYEDVARFSVAPGWQAQVVDLRRFSEWKFSLFYEPLRRSWRLVINAEGPPGGQVALDRPVLTQS
jgi:hypothetical protein